jgi:hypothetical protein
MSNVISGQPLTPPGPPAFLNLTPFITTASSDDHHIPIYVVARGDIDDSTFARYSLPVLFRCEAGQQVFSSRRYYGT